MISILHFEIYQKGKLGLFINYVIEIWEGGSVTILSMITGGGRGW